ncbi:MAG: 4'-phosphopantetheinyl transferase superfamily protein [Oscillatoriales cyanobacterium SM2_1_8]|nr:4'-phosphopantetheinyl transferase superfamily protein [Oscillatoriales cyanobacterium SM2_1_8]
MGRAWYGATAAGPAGIFPLAPDEIRLWRLAVGHLPTETLMAVLPPEEQTQCRHLHFGTGRWLLRQVLGGLLGRSPRSLRLAFTAAGKPYLPHSPLRFNLTHSRSLVLLAVTAAGEVGIDVEWSGRPTAIARLARRFFDDGEQQWLAQHGAADFWAMWTCKEARAKLRGESLGSHLGFSTVPIVRGWRMGQTTVTVDGDTFEALTPWPDYVAVLAW